MACDPITEAQLVAIAPELSGIDAARLAALNDLALCYVGKKIEDAGKCDIAMVWMVAHLATVSGAGGFGGGSVASEKLGDLETRFHASATTPGGLSGTTYGREYQRFIRTVICPAAIRFVPSCGT